MTIGMSRRKERRKLVWNPRKFHIVSQHPISVSSQGQEMIHPIQIGEGQILKAKLYAITVDIRDITQPSADSRKSFVMGVDNQDT